ACGEVDRDHLALGLAQCGQDVVGLQRVEDIARGDLERGHAVRLHPYAHGEGATADDLGTLHAGNGRELGFDRTRQVVGDLVVVEQGAVERQVHRRNLFALLQFDHRVFRLRRQLSAQLVDLGGDLGEGLVRVAVQADVGLDGGRAGGAVGHQVVDAFGAGDFALERRGDEALDQVGVGTEVGGADVDDGVLQLGVLAYVQ